ncbi:glycosyltransferase family 4 protein [Gulosibacter molinativorax]|uniref:D-inositol 3-phosphate glycosyltransferase n=1 Tax=Gulosibacter molinativorax TaxID=256821 RepID=A0ABT7C7V9_9MICO|nr:glycosyltransferase family 1 protein [Gulosibacter molinativorax]MDJ1371218.1 glycosyltransferase family 1 protein [Gulosibacter molinativorax]QUY63034.1 Glycosyltransferase, group 1 family protein [Gulosibacter molinativorax]
MRIALFTEVFLPKIDGVVTRVLRTLEHLEALGHEVLVFAPGDPPSNYAGARVIRVNSVPLKPWYPELKIGMPTPNIAKLIEEFAPHVVHLVNPVALAAYGALSAARRDLPMLASFHTDTPQYADALGLGPIRRAGTVYLREIHNLAEVNLCTSPQMVERAEEMGIERVDLWPKAIDTVTYHPDKRDPEMRETLTDGHPEHKLMIYVGRMSKEKNLRALLPQIRKFQDSGVRLAMVGSGPDREELEQDFADTNTVFTGYMSGDALASAFASADVFAFPSTTETLGLVALESMASQVPVVAARAGGIPFAVTEGRSGFLFDPKSEDEFTEGLEKLLFDDELRIAMGAEARREAEESSWRSATEKLVSFYEEAIDRHWARAHSLSTYSLRMRLFGKPMPRPTDLRGNLTDDIPGNR